ncbi:DNA-3-methyladenine glycosylase I [Vitreoscilla stercoraria]|uniref:DNA-3-methyladenine glycosylase I n=1 Tax=Vitreoscilla stercoraria TaxID=61 RepID=A0ABY4EAH4_VITST|nr:DNA-3-methyladenine glycosylase I [Vitreoscilla stercoraria]UOO92323.1 DNA-3-methyladenine glycosylase I [Vitreoscilla stercoraria]
MSYCQFVQTLDGDDRNPHKHYHDHLYGYSVASDDELFARLVLEINQAGLSWSTILNKWDGFYQAYHDFEISKVAAFDAQDVARLLQDASIVRNRLKVHAAIYNAQQIVLLQQEYGSFKAWLEHHHPLAKSEWVKVFKQQFKFVGGEIVSEFLMSTGYLPGAHDADCPILMLVEGSQPPYLRGTSQ